MNWKEIIYWFSDASIMNVIDIIRRDFLMMVLMFGGGVIYVIKRFTKWTPWTSDDQIGEKIESYFGINKKGDGNEK